MKKFILGFIKRGLVSCGFGPIILAMVYLILCQSEVIATMTVNQVCIGIFSTSALAFIAGGMNAIYMIEHLPLMLAILIHGMVLYVSYIITYLINNWIDFGIISIVVFSAIFVLGYIAIWIIIFNITKRKTTKINKALKKKQYTS